MKPSSLHIWISGILRLFSNVRAWSAGRLRWPGLLASVMTVGWGSVSCQSARDVPTPHHGAVRYQAGHWNRVSAKPPVYYPRGVAANSPSGVMDGEWYRVCDAADTRYFIPFKLPPGSNRMGLVAEVKSLRMGDYSRQMKREEKQESEETLKRAVKNAPVLVPLNLSLGLLGAFGGHPILVSPEEYEQWRHSWKEKYGDKH